MQFLSFKPSPPSCPQLARTSAAVTTATQLVAMMTDVMAKAPQPFRGFCQSEFRTKADPTDDDANSWATVIRQEANRVPSFLLEYRFSPFAPAPETAEADNYAPCACS